MIAYADTNFLTALISTGEHGDEAQRLRQAAINGDAPPFPVTFLTRMEVINAIYQQVFFTRNGVPGIHASPEAATIDESLFLDELELGETMMDAEIDTVLLREMFGALARRFTIQHGFRAYDIIHVASARLLGCDTFWSFDARAKKLARLEGLKVN